MLKFRKGYFFLSLILLLVLIYIALFVNDNFVRPFLGDVLVVCWLYLVAKSVVNLRCTVLAHGVLLFALAIEVGQFYNLVAVLGLEDYKVARIVIGSTFDWLDILAYVLGWLSIIVLERYRHKLKH